MEIEENIKRLSSEEAAFDYAKRCYYNKLEYPCDIKREL